MSLASIYNLFSRPYLNKLLAAEISSFSNYYSAIYHLAPRAHDDGRLLNSLICSQKLRVENINSLPQLTDTEQLSHLILLNGNFNHNNDIQELLNDLKRKLSRSSRVVAVVYNSYLSILYKLANKFGIRKGELPETFLTRKSLNTIAKLSGYEIVRSRPVGYIPFHFLGLGTLLNRFIQVIPILRNFGFAEILLFRPLIASNTLPSLSIIIPARNEKGNIENALKRIPEIGDKKLEIIFVEGHSTDDTWAEIQRVMPLYQEKYSIKAFKQEGRGKNNAVRLGFSHASGDLLTILDADLTMPPELLGRFYHAYTQGLGDFVNGSRLVYPAEGEAMRFLNHLGNIFFAKMLSAVLEAPISDSLCGTKLLTRRDYVRICAWRKDFGDFDPFGDFELLFPAASLGFGIIDLPIQYRARTYGSTNIHRFRHGFLLLKMTAIGFFRIRLGKY